jgi:hypothetical protein
MYTQSSPIKTGSKTFSINSSILLEEFTLLYMALPSVHLIDHKDLIHWKWTTDGKYGQLSELKCRFFGWLTLHDMVLTADNLLKRNWDCNYNCSLCLCIHETTEHLLTRCNFSEAVWDQWQNVLTSLLMLSCLLWEDL